MKTHKRKKGRKENIELIIIYRLKKNSTAFIVCSRKYGKEEEEKARKEGMKEKRKEGRKEGRKKGRRSWNANDILKIK